MSANLYVSFENPIDSVDPNGSDRVFICKYQEELDELATAAAVKPLSAFLSYSEEELADMGMDAPDDFATKWFSPTEVKATLNALLSGLDGLSLKRPEDVRIELTELLSVADAAEKNSTKLRFYVGF